MSQEEMLPIPIANKRLKLATTEEDGSNGHGGVEVESSLKFAVTVDEGKASTESSLSSPPLENVAAVTETNLSSSAPKLSSNSLFTEENAERLEKLRKGWENLGHEDQHLSTHQSPFRHGSIPNFVENQDFVKGFAKLFSKIEFHEKASDLFQFKQSDDLNSVVDPHVYALNQYLGDKVLPFLKRVTGLPLNETVDMFLSIYKQNDFLLCHDDELDSRRIAFIWYLSEEWEEGCGGTLDLFSATDDLLPGEVVKKIVPEYNKFVFFEVGATSYHQVSEVTHAEKSRYALSGWFYGEPLSRPKIEFPIVKSHNVLEAVQKHDGILNKFCADMYMNPSIFSEINEQLSEESEVLVPGFLRDEVYEALCKAVVDLDVSSGSSFSLRGPKNVSHFTEAIIGPPIGNVEISDADFTPTIESLRTMFYSEEFLNFMEKITEFPFTSCPENKVVSSLQKYSHGSYSLLRIGGAKHTGIRTGIPEQEVIEEEEDPNLVDVMLYFANNWSEERGGLLIYSTTDGEQLITVPPEGNCLAVVVRSCTVNAYTNYVNCLAKDDMFFVYKMTFAFDGKL